MFETPLEGIVRADDMPELFSCSRVLAVRKRLTEFDARK